MPVSQRDIVAAIRDLVDLIELEHDPLARLRLLAYVVDIADETLSPATDKALYESRLGTSTIDDVVLLSGWGRWRVKEGIIRHCAANDLPLPYRDRGPLSGVYIM